VERGYVTFGCFNNLAKLTDGMIATWARVLQAVPQSRLQLKGHGLADDGVQARYLARFGQAGVDPGRIELRERTAGLAEHLGLYGGVDVALDTFPYHGTTTTCEALWMGRPVVTLAGEGHMARVGVSLLSAVGRSDWIARDADAYVRIAQELAANRSALVAASQGLRSRLRASPLLDHAGQSERFAKALRRCWRVWCERVGQAAVTTAAGAV
jgi:predicted O-linked N-acetylglucosamine transferase (SPINDLY family)